MDVLALIFFDGRIGRVAFWGLTLLSFLFNIVASIMLTYGEANESLRYGGYAVLVLTVIMGLATGVKRYHDRDKSGWWVFIGLIPIIGWLWSLIELGFLAGTEGYNTYGSPGSGSPFGGGSGAGRVDTLARMRS